MKRKGGFTLIETIVSIFIITLVYTMVISSTVFKDNLEREMQYDFDIYEIQNILTLSKAECKKENLRGHILVNTRTDEIYFYCNSEYSAPFRKIQLSDKSDCITENKNLYLTDNGKISVGNTISVRNSGEMREITIGVGIDTIRIKD